MPFFNASVVVRVGITLSISAGVFGLCWSVI